MADGQVGGENTLVVTLKRFGKADDDTAVKILVRFGEYQFSGIDCILVPRARARIVVGGPVFRFVTVGNAAVAETGVDLQELTGTLGQQQLAVNVVLVGN